MQNCQFRKLLVSYKELENIQACTQTMRDSPLMPGLQTFTYDGGKDPNYLVRSWVSSLGNVTQGHKTPKSDYRSTWLQRLNHVELLQNVQVQQNLRNMMSILKAEGEIIKDSDSAYEFAERRRVENCHKAVCKITEGELNKRLMKLSTWGNDHLKAEPLDEGDIVRGNKQEESLQRSEQSLPVSNAGKRLNFSSEDICHVYGHEERLIQNRVNDFDYNYNNSIKNEPDNLQAKRKISLPPIPEARQEKCNPFNRAPSSHHRSSLLALDAASKFSIIRRAKEIRNERNADTTNQSSSSMTSKLQRKFSKARKQSVKNNPRIEIFADNREILENKLPKNVTEKTTATLPLLDTKSFSEIDCNDYLNVKNQLDGLSPVKAILDHKLHWPATRTKQK